MINLKVLSSTILFIVSINFFFFVNYNSVIYNKYKSRHIYHSGPTHYISKYQVVKKYKAIKPGGTMYWHLSYSPGGEYYSGMNIIRKIDYYTKTKRIKNVFIIKGFCNSMCTIFASTAHRIKIRVNRPLVFHVLQNCNRRGRYCKPVTSGRHHRHFMRHWKKYIKSITTRWEYKMFLKGYDVQISSKRMYQRWPKWKKQRFKQKRY